MALNSALLSEESEAGSTVENVLNDKIRGYLHLRIDVFVIGIIPDVFSLPDAGSETPSTGLCFVTYSNIICRGLR